MKRIITVLLFGMMLSLGCVQEEPINGDYEFCDALTPCESGDCYKFEDKDKPICFEGDPCSRCPSGECYILESYPMQIRCVDEEPICEDLCGDGICQEIVCLATGCPCAETHESCPEDCP